MTHTDKNLDVTDTRRGVELFKENPFVSVAIVSQKTRRVTSKRGDMMLVNREDGEIQSSIAGFWQAEEVDSTKFIKLFVNGVKALAELTNAGTKVFEMLYIEMQSNIGKDRVYLSYSGIDGLEKTFSRTTFSRGIAELIEKKFIAATPMVSWYWVNPDFIWNGDRLAFVKEYRLKSSTPRDMKDREALEAKGQKRLDLPSQEE